MRVSAVKRQEHGAFKLKNWISAHDGHISKDRLVEFQFLLKIIMREIVTLLSLYCTPGTVKFFDDINILLLITNDKTIIVLEH